MVWGQVSRTAKTPDGASASVMGTIIPGITRGGDPWVITDAAGIRITDGARGAGPRWRTSMESGAIRRIHAPRRLGRIRIRAIMGLRAVAPTTTHKQAGRLSQGADTTPISTRGTLTGTAGAASTTRIPEW